MGGEKVNTETKLFVAGILSSILVGILTESWILFLVMLILDLAATDLRALKKELDQF